VNTPCHADIPNLTYNFPPPRVIFVFELFLCASNTVSTVVRFIEKLAVYLSYERPPYLFTRYCTETM